MFSDNDHTLSHSEDLHVASNEMPACSIIQNKCNSSGTVYINIQPELVSDDKLEKSSSTEGIGEVRQELLQTRALVTDLETRLDVIERTSQVIVDELKNLIDELQYGESHSTVVDDRQSEIDFGFNDCTKSNTNSSVSSSPSTPTASSALSTPTICCDDDNPTFERISATLQSLIHDAELALDRTSKYLDLPKRRSRASSWSSSVSSWIVNKYSPTPSRCGNEHCVSCEELPSGKQNTTEDNTTGNCVCKKEELNQKQQQIKQYYRQQLERHYDYTKSCNDLEDELQKLMHIAFSSSTVTIDEQQTHHKDENLFYSNNNNNSNNNVHNSNTMDRHRIDSMRGQLQGINDNTSNISKLRHWMSWEYFRSTITGFTNYTEYIDAEATSCMDGSSRVQDEIHSEDWCCEHDDDWYTHSSARRTSSSPQRYSASHSRSSSTSRSSSLSDDGLVINTLNINPNITNIHSIAISSSFSSLFLSTIIHSNFFLLRYIFTSGGVIFRTLFEQPSTRPVMRTGINAILGKSMKRRRQVRPMVALLKYLIVLIFGWFLGRGSASRRRITKTSSDRIKAGEDEEYQALELIRSSGTKLF